MDKYRLPAEWEPQSAVQLTWPTPLSDWRDNIREINATYVEMATAIARYEKVLIVASAMCSIPTSLRRNKNVRMVREEYNEHFESEDTDPGGVLVMTAKAMTTWVE